MKASDYIVDFFIQKNISKVFGYIGGMIAHLADSIYQSGHIEMVNTITEQEKQYIISLYKRSNASIRKFCKFYKKRSYSCIWHVLKEAGLI